MKNVKKALAAAVLAVACGSALASSTPTGTINIYTGMTSVIKATNDPHTNPSFYELNVVDTKDVLTFFSLVDTNTEQRTVNYWLYNDIDGTVGSVDLGATVLEDETYVDLLGDGIGGTFSHLLTSGAQYVLKIAVSGGSTAFSASTQISAVPLPAAAWLFGSALVGLGIFRRRKQVVAV